MSRNTPIKLKIPRQDLQDFEFFELSAAAAANWVQNLPMSSAGAASQQLRQVVSHLNRVEVAPQLRFEILEAMRNNLLTATSNLSKRYLNQPLVMPEEPRQMAALADSLTSAACTGYTITAIQTLQQRGSISHSSPARLVGEAIHRAMQFAGARLLLAFQLYRPVELNGWLTLHQLYVLAEGQELTRLTVTDPLIADSSISSVYLQALLLGCSKPNQMRQNDLRAIYRGLQDWTPLMEIAPNEHGKGLFLVDLDTDQPPLYSSVYNGAPGPRIRYLDTGPLVDHLQEIRAREDKQGVVFDRNTVIPPNLLEHLIASLGSMSKRNFTRTKTGRPMWISVGLSAVHYHLAGEQDFEELVQGSDYTPGAGERLPDNPFLSTTGKRDLWREANPEENFSDSRLVSEDREQQHEIQVDARTRAALAGLDEDELDPQKGYPAHRVAMVNVSPGGYCFEWSPELPGDIKTGDIVAARENLSSPWVLAVIRWMSQLENARTLIGLELLSPRAEPYGARLQQKTGDLSQPMRVLLLPEIKLVGQPHTLITPRAGFRERQKIILQRGGEQFYIQLLRQIAVTGAFAQFDFRYIKQLGEVLAEDKTRPQSESFDSLWTNI